MSPKYKVRRYQFWSYDVWGNARDGFEVNDRHKGGTVDIRCRIKVYNQGTDMEFHAWDPTDRQLTRAVGFRGLSWDGESDYTLYAENTRNGRPVGELEFLGFVDRDGNAVMDRGTKP